MRAFSGEKLKRVELALRRSPVGRKMLVVIGALAIAAPLASCGEQGSDTAPTNRPDNAPGLSGGGHDQSDSTTDSDEPADQKPDTSDQVSAADGVDGEIDVDESEEKYRTIIFLNPDSAIYPDPEPYDYADPSDSDEIGVIEDPDVPPYSEIKIGLEVDKAYMMSNSIPGVDSWPLLGINIDLEGLETQCQENATHMDDPSLGDVDFFDDQGNWGHYICHVPEQR